MLGLAISTFKAKIVKEQELLMRISDIIIATYIAESVVLKTEKLIDINGYKQCSTQIQMTINYIHDAINNANKSAHEIIITTTSGIKQKFLLSISNKLTRPLENNIKEIRRQISNNLKDKGKYDFSI
tara:strand:- start:274 stop:654 length:381 start_codon:yes stop_codon:yes gene_type:complete